MELQDSVRQFESRGASLIAVSADSLEDARAMVERLELTYAVASNTELDVIDAYGVRHEGRDIAVPATFVLSGEGKVIYRRVGETVSDRPESELLLDVLDGGGTPTMDSEEK